MSLNELLVTAIEANCQLGIPKLIEHVKSAWVMHGIVNVANEHALTISMWIKVHGWHIQLICTMTRVFVSAPKC